LNGVSTLDLVLIQKHILSIQDLDSPYKVIAADANRSGSVTATDLISIRKVILGLDTSFPNDNMPWRFVDSDQTWEDSSRPFPYSEMIAIANHSEDSMHNDFIAVKIGDVNGSAVINGFADIAVSKRNANSLELVVDNESFNRGDIVEIPVTAANFENIAGTQFTMSFDNSLIEFVGITAGAMNLTESNFGHKFLSEGYVTTSYNGTEAESFDSDEVLFTVNVEAIAEGNVASSFAINSDVTRAEAYTQELETMNVQLTITGQVEGEGYSLYQNIPNPFGSETTISFRTPVDGPVTLTIYDVNGKLIKKISDNFTKGTNNIIISADELQRLKFL